MAPKFQDTDIDSVEIKPEAKAHKFDALRKARIGFPLLKKDTGGVFIRPVEHFSIFNDDLKMSCKAPEGEALRKKLVAAGLELRQHFVTVICIYYSDKSGVVKDASDYELGVLKLSKKKLAHLKDIIEGKKLADHDMLVKLAAESEIKMQDLVFTCCDEALWQDKSLKKKIMAEAEELVDTMADVVAPTMSEDSILKRLGLKPNSVDTSDDEEDNSDDEGEVKPKGKSGKASAQDVSDLLDEG